MNRLPIFCLFLLSATLTAQSLYVTTHGDSADPAIIFLHGGPGYNAASFERAAADSLAARGFFVVTYDRRGEGRSPDPAAAFTFGEAVADLLGLYTTYDLRTATLLGHSFGGALAVRFAEVHPDRVKTLILVGAPLVFQRTLSDIIDRSRRRYTERRDTVNLRYLDLLERMDTASMPYSNYAFAHAVQNGFYRTPTPTAAADALYANLAADSTFATYAGSMTPWATMGFWKNESYTTLDLRPRLVRLPVPVLGLYGKDDGLFSAAAVRQIGELLGPENLHYLAHASHSVFIDRRQKFLDLVADWLRQ